jgi:y4mF family transcriptional regulator
MYIDDPADLGARLRDERRRLGVTQEQLAAAAGVNPRLVSEVERGKATAEVGKVLDIARALGLRLSLEAT